MGGGTVMTLDQLSAAATEAIKTTGYKYFGDYELSKDQWEAVDALVEFARVVTHQLRTGQLVAVADDAIERLLWHVEQCLGPISRETCEVVGDDDYSILRHNFKCVLAAKGTGGE